MNEIIEKLSEAENAASEIVENAKSKKPEIFAQVEEEKKAFDKEIDAKLQKEVEALNEKLVKKRKEDLESLTLSTKETLKNLEEKFTERRVALADSILKKIIGA